MIKLAADVSRCDGSIYFDGIKNECPQREKCLRFLSPPHTYIQVYIIIEGKEMVNNCDCFIELK